MRLKHLIGCGLCLAVAVVPASAAIGATATQTIDSQLGGKETPKFDKKTFKKTSIFVETTTTDSQDPSAVPPKATSANVKFDTKAVPGCSASQLSGTTTQDAVAACGNAKVGGGTATAALPFGPGGSRQDFPVTVTAFNRSDAKGILLHARVDQPLNTTTVLTGTIAGTTLSLQIPPLGGGVGAIAQFNSKVQAKDYVQGRCKSKTIKTSSTFTFSDAPPASASDTQNCKQKSS